MILQMKQKNGSAITILETLFLMLGLIIRFKQFYFINFVNQILETLI